MDRHPPLITARPEGLYCAAGDFYIDPWRPVDRAVITHAHSDHARSGHRHYLCAAPGAGVLRSRLGDVPLQTLAYGERIRIGDAQLSLHPAGHVLGSAQVRVEAQGRVWVASGDYKLEPDPTCEAFEPVPCNGFITESTFGLPIYRWRKSSEIMDGINAWWRENAEAGRCSVLFCYAFGKAQRILSGLDPQIGPILVHGAVEPLNAAYRAAGVALPQTRYATENHSAADIARAIVLAPPSAGGSIWMRRFGDYAEAFASGWMQVRAARKQRGVERGFALSDHADWPGLLQAIGATGAEQVFVTHGQVEPLIRYLREAGIAAQSFRTEYGAEEDAAPADAKPDEDRADTGDLAAR